MEWYWIALIVQGGVTVLASVFVYALSLFAYKIAFGRANAIAFDELDLTTTKYKGLEDRILPAFKFMREQTFEDHYIRSFDGLTLHASYKKGDKNKLVVMVPGYHADPLNNFAIIAMRLIKDGYSVLLINLRAHEKSEGKWTTFGCLESKDFLDWVKYADETFKPEAIYGYGVSLGCASLEIASSSQFPASVKCLVCDCGFASPYEQIRTTFHQKLGLLGDISTSLLPMHAVIIGKFNLAGTKAYKELAKATVPCFFIHGGKDTMVPISRGQLNYEYCSSKKEKAFFADAGHNQCFTMYEDEIMEKLKSFVSSL